MCGKKLTIYNKTMEEMQYAFMLADIKGNDFPHPVSTDVFLQLDGLEGT